MISNFIHAVWDRWANIHPVLRFLLLVVAVALTGVVALNPAYQVFKSWRILVKHDFIRRPFAGS